MGSTWFWVKDPTFNVHRHILDWMILEWVFRVLMWFTLMTSRPTNSGFRKHNSYRTPGSRGQLAIDGQPCHHSTRLGQLLTQITPSTPVSLRSLEPIEIANILKRTKIKEYIIWMQILCKQTEIRKYQNIEPVWYIQTFQVLWRGLCDRKDTHSAQHMPLPYSRFLCGKIKHSARLEHLNNSN